MPLCLARWAQSAADAAALLSRAFGAAGGASAGGAEAHTVNSVHTMCLASMKVGRRAGSAQSAAAGRHGIPLARRRQRRPQR